VPYSEWEEAVLKISVIVSDSGCTTGKPEVETDGRGGATMTLPRGAYYSLTESAHSPFHAEPAHFKTFVHSYVGHARKLEDYLQPTEPVVPHEGIELECPKCKTKAVYYSTDLRYISR
jgi:hypothetical protein